MFCAVAVFSRECLPFALSLSPPYCNSLMERLKTPPALDLRCPPIEIVRIGLIGLGQRGLQTVRRYTQVQGAEIRYFADLSDANFNEANGLLRASGFSHATCFSGDTAWREVCLRKDVDLVYICTDWSTHAGMAVEAMRSGKHVAVEVPAATTVEECRQLVLAAEDTRRHCFMTENCCYDWFSLATMELRYAGFFGTITHCEGAYIHDWRKRFAEGSQGTQTWYKESCWHGGNPYPTHGIGPIARLLDIHRKGGDRFRWLVSVTGSAAGADSPLGHSNTTLLTTERGVTILLQFDGTTPRPYSRLQTVCGTDGFARKYPLVQVQHEVHPLLEGDAAEAFMRRHLHGHAAQLWLEGHRRNVENEMNYAMDCRLIHCLRHGLPLDIDVYDAAEWSCLAELSQLSARNGGARMDLPDFLNLR